jgi:hypothetical protein
MATRTNGTAHAPANYLEGDPDEPESIMDGRLDCEPGGLRFSSADGGELLLGIDSLLGISISGRAAVPGRNAIRGTMRVAGLSHGEPAEWVFAVDRSAAARLQDQLNRELAARGKRALPHIEELVGFRSPRVTRLPAEAAGPPPPVRAAVELGHRLDGADRGARRKRRVLPWVALATVIIALEVLVPLIILRGG